MHILLAPDKFKGTLTAQEVAEAIQSGLVARFPQAEFRRLPLADGGDGTLEACQQQMGGILHSTRVMDALGSPTVARWLVTQNPSTGQDIAILESAEAIGLAKIRPQDRNALMASSYGLGQLLREADRLGIPEVWVGVGGSASTDGGAGMLAALGSVLLDQQGRELPLGGGALCRLATLDFSASLRFERVRVLSDVTHPLLGPSGAAAVFAPQKGASPEDVIQLEAGLQRLADCAAALPGVQDARDRPGAGAAGGLGWALMTFLNATLHSGADVLLETQQAQEAIRWADWIITGEGKLDAQTLGGKAIHRLLAAAGGKPVSAVVGQTSLTPQEIQTLGLKQAVALAPTLADLPAALAHPADACRRCAGQLHPPS